MTSPENNQENNTNESLSGVQGPQPLPDQLATDPPSSGDQDLEQLTAYLDGELDSSAMQRVEARLAEDHAFRTRLQQLQRTWDLLDELPLSEPTQSFTKSTIELVVLDATKTIRQKRQTALTWTFRTAIMLSIPLAMFAASSWLVSYLQNSEYRKLVQDLPLIENIDVYRKAESIEFLTALDESGLFDDEELVEGLLDEN